MYNSVVFHVLTSLYICHHYLVPEHSRPSEKKLSPSAVATHPLPQPLAPVNPPSVSGDVFVWTCYKNGIAHRAAFGVCLFSLSLVL